MKILLTGANGFVGSSILATYKDMVVPAPSLRGMDQEQITRLVEESGADVIVHTAAIADMWRCEENPDASYQVNVLTPVMLANAAKGRKLIYFSSDQVYNGSNLEGPYKEGDESPSNVYAKHKLEMENRVLDICPESVMLRAEWMYGLWAPKEDFYSLLHKENRMTFSSKQYRGVTYVREVSENILKMSELPGGAYNFGSETDQSILEIAEEFARYIGRDIEFADGRRGHNLWMDCSKAKSLGVQFSTVLNGLKRCKDDSRQA